MRAGSSPAPSRLPHPSCKSARVQTLASWAPLLSRLLAAEPLLQGNDARTRGDCAEAERNRSEVPVGDLSMSESGSSLPRTPAEPLARWLRMSRYTGPQSQMPSTERHRIDCCIGGGGQPASGCFTL